MSVLNTLIEEALQEKNEKLIPENIKEGITIFGVTGTYTGELVESTKEESN